jgi:hypothetical protein
LTTSALKYKKIDLIWNFFKWVLFIASLQSFNAWFFWSIKSYWISLAFILISLFVMFICPAIFSYSRKKIVWMILYLLACLITTIHDNLNIFLSVLISAVPVYFVILLKREYKSKYFQYFTKIFGILIGISVAAWVMHLLGVSSPWTKVGFGESDSVNSFQYIYENHYLYLVNITTVFDGIIPRFSSVFLEPGYLGCLLAVILYLNEYKFKGNVYAILFLVALFFTFSLAGWLLGIFGFTACKLKNSKSKVIIIVVSVLAFIGFRNIAVNYNSGNNIINQFFFERLKFGESDNIIAGYNRTGTVAQQRLDSSFLQSDGVLLGSKTLIHNDIGVDCIAFILYYGFVSLLIYLTYLLYPCCLNKKYDQYVLLFLYIGIFIQTYHGIFWLMYQMLYIIGFSITQERVKS